MSAKYLSKVAVPNQQIDLRVNNVTIDGQQKFPLTESGRTAAVPGAWTPGPAGPVTINQEAGFLVLPNIPVGVAAGTSYSFTMYNSAINSLTAAILVTPQTRTNINDHWLASCTGISTGSCGITISNVGGVTTGNNIIKLFFQIIGST